MATLSPRRNGAPEASSLEYAHRPALVHNVRFDQELDWSHTGSPTREVHSPNVVECAGGSPVVGSIVCSIHLLSPVQVKVFRCVCGFRVRAMLSQGRSAAFRMDPETWQKLCAYSNQVHAPRDCPRFLEAIDSCGRTGRRSPRPRRPCS